jgi:hypothetical protein
VGRGQPVVNLDGVAELDDGFLVALLFEEGLAALDVLGLGRLGALAACEAERRDEDGDKKGDGERSAGALLLIHLDGNSLALGRDTFSAKTGAIGFGGGSGPRSFENSERPGGNARDGQCRAPPGAPSEKLSKDLVTVGSS